MTTVREIMTPDPEHVDAATPAHEVAAKMSELNVGSVPVIENGEVCGIITDRDITIRVIAEDQDPREVRAGAICTPDPVTVSPDTDATKAAQLMAEHQIRRLPVVDGKRLVGMVSLGDISVEGSAREAGKALQEISEPGESQR